MISCFNASTCRYRPLARISSSSARPPCATYTLCFADQRLRGEGIMLPRTEFEMSENIRDFTVVYCGTQLLGCGALHFYTPTSPKYVFGGRPGGQKSGCGRFS